MKIIITESQYKFLLSEQSNVYTDEAKYKKALRDYNKKMAVYQMSLELYKERANWRRDSTNPAFNTPNFKKVEKFTNSSAGLITTLLDSYYRCKQNLPDYFGVKEPKEYCVYSLQMFKDLGNPQVEKWYEVHLYSLNGVDHNMWIPIFKKPTIQKPILKKTPTPTPTKQEPPKVNKPVEPIKASTPPTPPSTLDKTKPVDFYFGNKIFRAPNYDIAQSFVNKLSLHNFNSNKVDVLKDKSNERWFVGYNDKIYLNQKLYDQDPNKNVYVDPIKMGLISL